MNEIQCFDYAAGEDAIVLILGSMPGVESLRQQQYYAHPRNAFWPIMGELLGFDPALPYQQRLQLMKTNKIALWDVAHQCVRPGSLDADMRNVEANDFTTFFAQHSHIRTVFFNGGKAEALYGRLVLPQLSASLQTIPRHRLPSTSPAHAAMDFKTKLAAWRIIQTALENGIRQPYE
ncbi:MAG: DNA-deoxyinosine glycosylase [Mariprofundaceae bacterium]